jgi:hypothetical protein
MPLAEVVAGAWEGREETAYAAPSPEEMQVMADLVAELAAAATGSGPKAPLEAIPTVPHGLPPSFAAIAKWNLSASLLGFELLVVRTEPSGGDATAGTEGSLVLEGGPEPPAAARYVALREAKGVRRGGGLYIFRADGKATGDGRAVVIQAPHSFFDEGTGEIAVDLFERSGATALMVNTVHRYQGVPGCGPGSRKAPPSGTVAPADVAHAARSSFQAATQGFSRAASGAAFVQIHGFAHDAHSEVPKDIDVIASKGETSGWRDARFDGLVARFRKRLGPDRRVAVFGRDAFSLGGLTNVQGAFVNAYSDDAFYHLELSRAIRTRLERSAALRADFAAALRPLLSAERESP